MHRRSGAYCAQHSQVPCGEGELVQLKNLTQEKAQVYNGHVATVLQYLPELSKAQIQTHDGFKVQIPLDRFDLLKVLLVAAVS